MHQQSLTWVSLELHEPTTTKQTEAVLALTIVFVLAFAKLQKQQVAAVISACGPGHRGPKVKAIS